MQNWEPKDFVTQWTKIARKNEAAAPKNRDGFIVRHNPSRFPGEANAWIPDEYATFFDLDRGTNDQQIG
jgi:hypothetical protein